MIDLPTRVLRLARALPEPRRTVIELRYGLSDENICSAKEVGRILKIPRQRAQDIENDGLNLIQLALGDDSIEWIKIPDLLIAARMRERAGLLTDAGEGGENG